ncbi:MAG: endonuclease III [Kosmotogaceae bacterium]
MSSVDCKPEFIAEKIIKSFPRYRYHKDPFRILISTVLSQRTRDENTEMASRKLFSVYRGAEELSKAKPKDLYELIKASGMYRQKSTRIIEIARIIHNKFNDKVPNNLEELVSLPGVGRKTANIVLFVGFGIPAMAVDTHVHRIANRIGWVHAKKPDDTEKKLVELIPEELWGPLNGSLVEFGKNICKPQKPLCDKCFIRDCCDYYRSL